jgi:hypothetical protein
MCFSIVLSPCCMITAAFHWLRCLVQFPLLLVALNISSICDSELECMLIRITTTITIITTKVIIIIKYIQINKPICLNGWRGKFKIWIAQFICSLHSYTIQGGAHSSVVGWGTLLHAGKSRVRFPMKSLDFSIVLNFPAALWPWGQLSL